MKNALIIIATFVFLSSCCAGGFLCSGAPFRAVGAWLAASGELGLLWVLGCTVFAALAREYCRKLSCFRADTCRTATALVLAGAGVRSRPSGVL